MEMKKQTVWLLTMLTVMVVLSAYYLMQGPSEQVPVVGEEEKEAAEDAGDPGIVIDTELETPQEGTENPADASSEADVSSDTGGPESGSSSDYFLRYRMERNNWHEKRMAELEEIMSSGKSADVIAEAKVQWEALSERFTSQIQLEELIKGLGYKEAVVVAKEDHVNVIVQADELTKEDAVGIISMVTEHIDVDGNDVTVIRRD